MNLIKRLKHKNLLLIGLVLFVLLFLPASNTYAASFFSVENIASNVIAKAFYYISLVLSTVGGLLFAFAAYLTSFVLDLNLNILGDTNTLVKTGWIITRDLANLGFVLVIIIIAFSTILRLSEYGNQKMLFRLIAAAILVNFSSAIAGVFIDFSNTITYFFLNKITEGGVLAPFKLASALAGAFNPQTFFGTPNFDGLDNSDVFSVLLTGIQSLIFITVFTLAGAFSLLAVAVMFFLRYLHLTFLIIVAPVVWLFWVTPQLASQFSKWWSSFFRWVFFAPASMFFIYLAVASAQGMSQQTQTFNEGSGVLGAIGAVVKDVLEKGAQMVVLIGILLGGLMIADQMGIEGAKGAVKGAKLIATGSAKGMGKFLGRATGVSGAAAGLGTKTTKGLSGLAGRMRDFAKTPGEGPLRKGLGRLAGVVGDGLQGTVGGFTGEKNPKNAGNTESLAHSLTSTLKEGVGVWAGVKKKDDKEPRTIKEVEKAIEEMTKEIEETEDDDEKTALTADLEGLEKGLEKLRQAAARRAAGEATKTTASATSTQTPDLSGFTTVDEPTAQTQPPQQPTQTPRPNTKPPNPPPTP